MRSEDDEEQASGHERLQLRALLEAIPDEIAVLDREGGYTSIGGLDGDAERTTVTDRMSPPVAARILERVHAALDSGELQLFEYEVADGRSAVHFEARLMPFAGEQVLAIVRDVTDRKRIELQLVEADRMVSLGTLAAGVAHEINNPLVYVTSNAEYVSELLEDPEATWDREAFKGAIADIVEGAARVRRIVDDLRLYAREEPPARDAIAVAEIVETALRITRHEYRHIAQIERDYRCSAPVVGQEGRLVQVLVNLLTNAAHAVAERSDPDAGELDGRIRVSTRLGDDGDVVIEVEDNGPGIPDELLMRVFDPFFTTKEVGKGTGLGLSISRSIVAQLGGTLALTSEPGRGTIFDSCFAPLNCLPTTGSTSITRRRRVAHRRRPGAALVASARDGRSRARRVR